MRNLLLSAATILDLLVGANAASAQGCRTRHRRIAA